MKRQCNIFNAINCDKMGKYTELEVTEHRQMFSFKVSLTRLPADGHSGDYGLAFCCDKSGASHGCWQNLWVFQDRGRERRRDKGRMVNGKKETPQCIATVRLWPTLTAKHDPLCWHFICNYLVKSESGGESSKYASVLNSSCFECASVQSAFTLAKCSVY